MGKRKSRAKMMLKTAAKHRWHQQKLDSEFTCPFCNHPNSVVCDIDNKELFVAKIGCLTCDSRFATKAHRLTEPVDVYAEWIDECERVKEERNKKRPQPRPIGILEAFGARLSC